MSDKETYLLLLQVTVPPATVVTVGSQVKILEILGIVSNHELIKTMQLTLTLVAPDTPATMKGLFQLLAGLIRLNQKSNKSHHEKLGKHLESLDTVDDAVLTFGTFLPICETLMKANQKKHGG